MISVSGPMMTGSASFKSSAFTFPGRGDLFEGMDKIMRFTTSHVTGLRLKSSETGKNSEVGGPPQMMSLSAANLAAASAAFFPTAEKKVLNSLVTVL